MPRSICRVFKCRESKNKGFTLIELLVVISIVSLLASVVFSNMRTTRLHAEDTATLTVLKELNKAVQSYVLDHRDQPTSNYGWSYFGKYYGNDCAGDPNIILNDELEEYMSGNLPSYISDGGCIFYYNLNPTLGHDEEYMILARMKTSKFLDTEPVCLTKDPSYSSNDAFYCIGVNLD